MGVGGDGALSAATCFLSAEICAPLLLLCGLCCWPLDDRSDTSSTGKGKHPQKPVVAKDTSGKGKHAQKSAAAKESSQRERRSAEALLHKPVCSAASLHLPSTSGHSRQSLSAHRSHEEIRPKHRAPRSLQPSPDEEGRYHSAPSVIHEVLHRRDWDRSARELYIPLRPDAELSDPDSNFSSPPAPHAEAESSSIECIHRDERTSCKKHYTNIKSSRNRTMKERNQDDIKDTDTTEENTNDSAFYIGDARNEASVITKENNELDIQSMSKAKDVKEYSNESSKSKKRTKVPSDIEMSGIRLEDYQVEAVDIDLDLYVDELDRSGAIHHDAATPGSLTTVVSRTDVLPAPSVETVGYEIAACYLAEGGLRARLEQWGARGVRGAGGERGRHASDGDILAVGQRPESGAFSESDLELELAAGAERPPRYEDLQLSAEGRKETAI